MGPELVLTKDSSYMTDLEYVDEIEGLTKLILGPYSEREHNMRLKSLGDLPRLNHVFDLMGIEYAEREDPAMTKKRERALRLAGFRVPRGWGRGRGKGRATGRGGVRLSVPSS